MPDEIPPLGKFVIASYDAGDLAYPIVVVGRNPAILGYTLPAFGDACPDPRYAATHKFTAVITTSLDSRVQWQYRKLPGATLTEDRFDDVKGAVQTTTQTIVATGSEQGTISIAAPIVTETRYEPVPDNDALLKKVVETFSLNNCANLTTTKYFPDADITITTTKTLKAISSISVGRTHVNGGAATITGKEEVNTALAFQVVTTIPTSQYVDLASANIEYHSQPWTFPGRLDVANFLESAGVPVGLKKPTSKEVLFTTKTFWVIDDTEPTLTGALAIFSVDYGANIYLPDGFSLGEVIHNSASVDYPVLGTVTYPATTPDYTTFLTLIGTDVNVKGSVETDGHVNRWKVTIHTVTMQ